MLECVAKQGSALKNWCFWIVVLKKILESLLDTKEIKPVNPKGNQPWIFIGRAGTKAEAPILWPPDARSLLIGKDSDAGKNWRQREKGTAEDEIVSITNSMDMNLNKLWKIVEERGAWCAAVYGVTESWTWLSDWTTKMYTLHFDTYCTTLTNLYFSLPPIKCIVLEDTD